MLQPNDADCGGPMTQLNLCKLFGTSFMLLLGALGTYLTAAVHPGFLPLLLIPSFVLCHVLVNPRAASQCYFGPPVIRYAMPEEFSYKIMVVKPQPNYMTIPVKKEVPVPAAPVRAATNCSAYCAPIVPCFQVPPTPIAVM